MKQQMVGLMQERRNSIANALELRLSRTNLYIMNCHDIYVLTYVLLLCFRHWEIWK